MGKEKFRQLFKEKVKPKCSIIFKKCQKRRKAGGIKEFARKYCHPHQCTTGTDKNIQVKGNFRLLNYTMMNSYDVVYNHH